MANELFSPSIDWTVVPGHDLIKYGHEATATPVPLKLQVYTAWSLEKPNVKTVSSEDKNDTIPIACRSAHVNTA